jgi:ABC-2 type transport system permease protein
MLDEASAHFYKQWKIMSRRPGEMAWIALYPLISLLSLGIFAYFVTTRGSPPETMLFILVGVIVWDVYNVAERSTSFGIALDIWADCLKHTFTGGSSFAGFVLGNGIFALFGAVSVFLLMALLGTLLFGFSVFGAGAFLLNLASVFIFAVGFGLLINSLMLTKGEKHMSLIWTAPGIIMIFSGIYYPIEILPLPVQAVSLALPTTHSLISMRASLGFSSGLALPEFLAGAALSLAYFALGLAAFRWSIRRSRVTGVITRY